MVAMAALTSTDNPSSVSLSTILQTFSAPISEEQAWAVCYQCAAAGQAIWSAKPNSCYIVSSLSHVRLMSDGTIDPATWDADVSVVHEQNQVVERELATSEEKIVCNLGVVVFRALDYGMSEFEERRLSASLESLIEMMACPATSKDPVDHTTHSSTSASVQQRHDVDDEGIERDSESSDDSDPSSSCSSASKATHASASNSTTNPTFTLVNVINRCTQHVQHVAVSHVEQHCRAVCRALVAECVELAAFLRVVRSERRVVRRLGAADDNYDADATNVPLDELNSQQWGRLWVQIVSELRHGVHLKKVPHCTNAPIEYELTPYEMLMDDIRSRRYKLKKVEMFGDIPCRVKKDAHAIILDFIRSRPPLRKASERKLSDTPMAPRKVSSHEKLMESIRHNDLRLRKIQCSKSRSPLGERIGRSLGNIAHGSLSSPRGADQVIMSANSRPNVTPSSFECERLASGRRHIKLDRSLLDNDDDDEESGGSLRRGGGGGVGGGGLSRLLALCRHRHLATADPVPPDGRMALDLATQSASFSSRAADRTPSRPHSVASSRRHSLLSLAVDDVIDDGIDESTFARLPQPHQPGDWTASQLQKQFLDSSHWAEMKCLALTLEEVVHIRSVLTRAELDSLPLECRLKEDVSSGRLCFLCMRRRFSLFAGRGALCRLCCRRVCVRCCSKMRIPTDHFATIPVYSLTPSSLSPQDEHAPRSSLMSKLQTSVSPARHRRRSVSPAGSASSTTDGDTVAGAEYRVSEADCGTTEPRLTHSLPFIQSSSDQPSHSFSRRLNSPTPAAATVHASLPPSSEQCANYSPQPPNSQFVSVCRDCKAMLVHISSTWRLHHSRLRAEKSVQ